ncbi:XRE family transcriptional regulator [Pseudonocardiaceae bacterium YIM PH 21723]|nr:XRE family transcriptional regulator [Pseudonocardiaceae bacterium YIM PH 21723]
MHADPYMWQTPDLAAASQARRYGAIVRAARVLHGLTLQEAVPLIGISVSTLSRIETGIRPLTDVDELRHFADKYGIPPRLFGLAEAGPSRHPQAADTVIGAIREEDSDVRRRELLATAAAAIPLGLLTRMDDALAVLPAPSGAFTPRELNTRLAIARTQFDAGQLTPLIRDLPDLLAAAHQGAGRRPQPQDAALLAACYNLATAALGKTGLVQSSRITADRAVTYAALSEDVLAICSADHALSTVLRREHRHEAADKLMAGAVNTLQDTGLPTLGHTASYAQLLATAAYCSAQAGDRDRALDLIDEAGAVAARLPAQPITGHMSYPPFTVDQAAVQLYKVGVLWSVHDTGAALAAGRELHAGQFGTAERRGRMHTDMARVWLQADRPEQTALHLLAAYRHAPGEVRDRPAIRKIAVDLTLRHPRVRGVSELAAAMPSR